MMGILLAVTVPEGVGGVVGGAAGPRVPISQRFTAKGDLPPV